MSVLDRIPTVLSSLFVMISFPDLTILLTSFFRLLSVLINWRKRSQQLIEEPWILLLHLVIFTILEFMNYLVN